MDEASGKRAKEILVYLGLTDYEARAYITLLRCQPASAYEISKESGIPSSKVYETVSRLQDKGLTQPVPGKKGRGQQYIALNSKEFIYSKRAETIRMTDTLGPLLDSIGHSVDADLIWQIKDIGNLFDKASQLINEAEDSILISIWPDEVHKLHSDLTNAQNRGVKVAMLHFGDLQGYAPIGATFNHPGEDTIYSGKGARALTLVVDSRVVLIGTFYDSGEVEAVWSQNHGFVTVSEDYIRHDIYITKVTTLMAKELRQQFGKNFKDMRNVFKPIP